MICPECNFDYPEYVPLNPIKGTIETSPICAICALEILNRHHSINRTKFPTPIAERNRQLAITSRNDRTARKVNNG